MAYLDLFLGLIGGGEAREASREARQEHAEGDPPLGAPAP